MSDVSNLPVNGLKWVKNLSKFHERFTKSYNENSDRGYFLEIDVEFPKNLFSFHKDFSYVPERKTIGKVGKLVCSVKDKEKYVVHIRTLKQALNPGLILKRIHRVNQFNQKSWLKPYIDMNTKLKKEAKNEFEKHFFKLMNNSILRKIMENVRKHIDIKLVITDEKRSKLVSEPNHYTTNTFQKLCWQ